MFSLYSHGILRVVFRVWRVDGAGKQLFSEGAKYAVLSFSFNFSTPLASFHAASRACRSCLSVSLPETDPQILEHWWSRYWRSPGQIIPSDGFWSWVFVWRTKTCVNRKHRIGFRMSELFRKIDEDVGGSISWNTQPICRVFFNMATALLPPFVLNFLVGCSSTWRCAYEHFSPNLQPLLDMQNKILEVAIFQRMNFCKFLWGNPCRAIETFYRW